MYKTYLWKVKPTSSFMTPWQSDTLYGHFIWAISYIFGQEETEKVVAGFKSFKPPFILSNGFIDGQLPMIKKSEIKRGDTKELAKAGFGDETPKSLINCIRELKKINKEKEISLEEFNSLLNERTNYEHVLQKLKSKELRTKKSLFKEVSVMHNVINRLSNSTEENGIYTLNEKYCSSNISIFIKIREDYPVEIVDTVLEYIESTGFGKKVSSGKGQISRVSFSEFKEFQEPKDANGYVVLSNFVPKTGDYSEIVSANLLTKRGKVANEGENPEFPFKKPFMCYTPGSVFKLGDNKVPGKILENIHIDKKVIQIGIPFVLGVKL